jgi:hypothetical protein
MDKVRSPDVRQLFGQKKKIWVIAPTAHITSPKGNTRMFVNLGEKKWQILRSFSRRAAPVGQVRRSGSNILPKLFFITERKKTHYCNPLYIFFVFN